MRNVLLRSSLPDISTFQQHISIVEDNANVANTSINSSIEDNRSVYNYQTPSQNNLRRHSNNTVLQAMTLYQDKATKKAKE